MRQVIYVLSHGNQWKIKCEHCKQGTDEAFTQTQLEAIGIARKHVASLPPGTLAQILVQRDDGHFRTEWTYGEDPFPPRG